MTNTASPLAKTPWHVSKYDKMSQRLSDRLPIFQHVGVDLSAPNEAMAEPETPWNTHQHLNSPSHAAEAKHLGGPVPLIETENLSKPDIPGFPERLVIAFLLCKTGTNLHHWKTVHRLQELFLQFVDIKNMKPLIMEHWYGSHRWYTWWKLGCHTKQKISVAPVRHGSKWYMYPKIGFNNV